MRSPRSFYLRVGCGYVVEGKSRVNKKIGRWERENVAAAKPIFFLNARKKDWLGSKRRINAGNPGCILRVNAFATRLSCSWPFRDVATGGFRGRHLFFVLLFLHREGPTQDKRRRGRGTQKRKGTKIFFALSFAWENKFFLLFSRRRRWVCPRVLRVVSFEYRWWFDAHRCFFEVPDLYTDPFPFSFLLSFSQNSSHKISICSTHRRLSKLPSTNLNA